MDRQTVLTRLADVAREQAGYVSTAQAKRIGVPSADLARLARGADLRRAGHGVYALPGSFGGPHEATIAAWLRLCGERLPWEPTQPAAVVSHASASAIYGFGTFVASVPTFTVVRRRFQPTDGSLALYTAKLASDDWRSVALPEGMDIAATTPARTVVDLAYVGEERDHVLDALAEARAAGLLNDDQVRHALDRRRSARGRGSVAWLADALGQS